MQRSGPERSCSGPSDVVVYRSELFDQALHSVDGFDSSEPSLDAWLKNSAATAQASRTSRTWVWVDGHTVAGARAVVAYYSLASHLIAKETLPRRLASGPSEIPAVLLAKLALDHSLHGRGLGSDLLWDALDRVLRAAEQVGTRLVVVDALHPKAAGFYTAHGFAPTPVPLRLVQKVSTIAAAAGRGASNSPR